MQFRQVGRVAGLFRYPVKSMAAEPLSSVEIGWHGLVGDRRWGFIRPGMEHSGFPWLTIRERSSMWQYQPSFLEPDDPDSSPTRVRTPSGMDRDVLDPALAAELGEGTRVIRQKRGVFDTAPLSLITTRAVANIAAQVGTPLAIERFRPNLVVEVDDDLPEHFPEDGWVGASVRLGDVVMRVDQRDRRCVMVNVDPTTTVNDATILRTIVREREGWLGVYGSVVTPGHVAIGDPVELEIVTAVG